MTGDSREFDQNIAHMKDRVQPTSLTWQILQVEGVAFAFLILKKRRHDEARRFGQGLRVTTYYSGKRAYIRAKYGRRYRETRNPLQ